MTRAVHDYRSVNVPVWVHLQADRRPPATGIFLLVTNFLKEMKGQ